MTKALALAVLCGLWSPADAAAADSPPATSEPNQCEAFENVIELPDGFVEAGHATLMEGNHLYYYENGECSCSDLMEADVQRPARHFECRPIRN